jgi:uncharacterized protein (UPF0548 family)
MTPNRRRLRLTRPDNHCISALTDLHRQPALTYSQIGWTNRSECPVGFAKNQCDAVIGNGEHDFRRAKTAIQKYDMLRLDWMQPILAENPIVDRSMVCTISQKLMVYSLNINRVVYVDDQNPNRFGFGFGTTAHHLIIGEERFTIHLDESSGDVTYEIFSFSRPRLLFFRLAPPWFRHLQRSFCIDSFRAMRAACQHGPSVSYGDGEADRNRAGSRG